MNNNKEKTKQTGLEIAVIGMAGRFPGAPDIETYWENLEKGIESITFFSDEELLETGIVPETLQKPNYVKAKGYIKEVEYFDASFFNYTPKEAAIMEPQVRIFHQCAYHALENAAYDARSYKGLIGIYAGYTNNIYWKVAHLLQARSGSESMAAENLNSYHFASNIAYKLNLRGPAVSLNTTCSTSLVAIHMACRALLTGEADMALAGGVSITLPNKSGYFYEEGMIMSPDGRSRPFDASANGIASGNGVGVVVLKRLVKAIKDRDHIYAVIKGSAINNDGNRKPGYTAPSVEAQAEVVQAAIQAARIEASSISFIEAHGTGTPMGDPIEIEALKKAFRRAAKKSGETASPSTVQHTCALGAVKANIGHLNAAAGVAAFIKTALSLYHGRIPATLNFQSPNPKCELENSPFYVNTSLKEWKADDTIPHPLRAGVSAYGIGGTNAHVILEEAGHYSNPADSEQTLNQPAGHHLLILSAKSKTALPRLKQNLVQFLKANPHIDLADVAYTLQVGRSSFEYRYSVQCRDVEEAVQALEKDTPVKAKETETGTENPVITPDSTLEEINRAWLKGKDIDWTAFYKGKERKRVPLPLYSFDKQAYNIVLPKVGTTTGNGAMELSESSFIQPLEMKDRPESSIPYTPPRNKAEEILARLWEELLGIRPIGVHDNLLEMEVDSLKAIMFANRFKEELGEVIDVTGVFEAPTIAGFATYFSTNYPDSKALSGDVSAVIPEIPKNFVMLHKPSQANGNIFFVHEVCGDVGAYLDFAKQAAVPFNCWGIEAEKLKNFTPRNVTVEQVAARYIRQVKMIQAHGPYYIATWSYGGDFTFDMVRQLEQMGEDVDFLAFFDCSGPNGRLGVHTHQEWNLETEKQYLGNFFASLGNKSLLDQMTDMEQVWLTAVDFLRRDEKLVAGLRELLKENAKAIPDYYGLKGEDLVHYLNVMRTFINAGAGYIPAAKIRTPIHYFRAGNNPDRADYWNEYCETPVIYYETRGDHHSIFRKKEDLVDFARKFNEVVNQVYSQKRKK